MGYALFYGGNFAMKRRYCFIGIATLLIICIVAYIIWCKSSWDWGSFVGGTIGGVGTLIAVYITTTQTRDMQEANQKKQEQNTKKENYRILFENTLIVYYDLKFALEDLYKFTYAVFNLNDETHISSIYEGQFQNTYFDKAWIQTVPKISTTLSPDELETVYNLYGKISTLLRCAMDSRDIKIDEKTFIENIILEFYNKAQNQLKLKENVQNLINTLENNLLKYGKYDVKNTFIDEIQFIRREM